VRSENRCLRIEKLTVSIGWAGLLLANPIDLRIEPRRVARHFSGPVRRPGKTDPCLPLPSTG